jgi:hypothetical protein
MFITHAFFSLLQYLYEHQYDLQDLHDLHDQLDHHAQLSQRAQLAPSKLFKGKGEKTPLPPTSHCQSPCEIL